MRKLLILIFLLLFTNNGYCATQLKKTVKPSGGDYTSLEACMNDNEQNLVTADKYFDVEIDGTWTSADPSAVTISGYTTDVTHYINIYTTATARHKGIYSTSYYRLFITIGGNGWAVTIANSNVRISGIQGDFTNSNNISYCGFFHVANQTNWIISSCIIKHTLSAYSLSYLLGVEAGNANNSGYIFNNIIYNIKKSSTIARTLNFQGSGSIYIYSNTFYNCDLCIRNGGGYTITTKNNGMSNCNTAYEGSIASKVTDSTSTPTFVSTSSGSENLHLQSSDTTWVNQGTDTSAESAPLNFADDIDGNTRSGTWDIGADEYVNPIQTNLIFNNVVLNYVIGN